MKSVVIALLFLVAVHAANDVMCIEEKVDNGCEGDTYAKNCMQLPDADSCTAVCSLDCAVTNDVKEDKGDCECTDSLPDAPEGDGMLKFYKQMSFSDAGCDEADGEDNLEDFFFNLIFGSGLPDGECIAFDEESSMALFCHDGMPKMTAFEGDECDADMLIGHFEMHEDCQNMGNGSHSFTCVDLEGLVEREGVVRMWDFEDEDCAVENTQMEMVAFLPCEWMCPEEAEGYCYEGFDYYMYDYYSDVTEEMATSYQKCECADGYSPLPEVGNSSFKRQKYHDIECEDKDGDEATPSDMGDAKDGDCFEISADSEEDNGSSKVYCDNGAIWMEIFPFETTCVNLWMTQSIQNGKCVEYNDGYAIFSCEFEAMEVSDDGEKGSVLLFNMMVLAVAAISMLLM